MTSSFYIRVWFNSSVGGVLKRNPLTFNAAIGGTLCGASDVVAQGIEQRQQQRIMQRRDETEESAVVCTWSGNRSGIDKRRLCSAVLIGSFFGGVVYPTAYARLDAIWVVGVGGFLAVLKKSMVEIFSVGMFVNTVSMTARGLLADNKGATTTAIISDVADHVRKEMPTVTLNDICVWLPYNLIAFSLIPAYIRPSTTALMEACWQTYISLRSNNYDHTSAGSIAVAQNRLPVVPQRAMPETLATMVPTRIMLVGVKIAKVFASGHACHADNPARRVEETSKSGAAATATNGFD